MNKLNQKSRHRTKFLVIFLSVFIWFINFQATRAATFVSGEISTNTVWTKVNSPYVVEYYLEVIEGAILTIEPGVIVKLDQSYIDVYGKIIASGTAQEKINFTSFLDDSVGGDTNGDSSATVPSPGDWDGLYFYESSKGSEFSNSDFRYASDTFYLDRSDLKLADSSVLFTSDIVISSNNSSLNVFNSKFEDYDYGIDIVGGNLILRNNIFSGGYIPVYADYETLMENSGNSILGNKYNGIGLHGSLYYVESDKIFHKDVPYILFDNLSINKNSTVTIEPGVVIKPDEWNAEINVYGTLKAVGKDDDKIIITSIHDDSAYGDTYPEDGDSLPDDVDWEGPYFGASSGASVLENVAIRYSEGIYFDSVNARLNRVNLENNYELDIYKGNIKITDSVIKNNHNGIDVYQGSVDLINSEVSQNKNTGIFSWGAKEINIVGSNINNNRYGIFLQSASTTISSSHISGNEWGGIYAANVITATISGNDIYNNGDFGIYNGAGGEVNAKNNWWGDESGPYHEILNPEGIGDVVSDGVIFTPWLKASIEEPAGFSSVAFIPGIQASRLYRQGLLWENQLWEPNWNPDVRKMFMDKDGKSVDSGIYTRDIIKETNVPVSADGLGLNIYKKFSESMDKMVSDGDIAAWKALPYDWRFDLSDIVGEGAEGVGGNISFINPKPEGQLPYMILELEKLGENSKNGKVTIITHSNGGLVAKALLKKLAEMKARGESDLIDKIDRLIMVASPQLGTPQAIVSMLHGDGQDFGLGFLLSKKVARELAENMLGAYNLLPSEKYVGIMAEPIVKFDALLDKINDWHTRYGDGLENYSELRAFLLGEGGRKKPDSSDTDTPNVLNASLLPVSENNHLALDDWQIPASIEVTQIAGWGLDTVSGVEYSVKEECIPVTGVTYCAPDYVLKRQPIFTSDGDETVVTPSVTAGGGQTYYLDLYRHNKFFEFNADREHKNIMEIISIQTLINEIIQEEATTTLPAYITLTKPESENKKLRLSIHSPVSIDIYDNLGNHTGIIPNPDLNSDLELAEENIPNSYYMNFGEGKYVGFDSGGQNKVELNGTGSGTFTLNIGEYSGDIEATSTAFVDIPVTSAMKGEINIQNLDTLPQLKIDVEGDGIFDFEVKPREEFDPILFLEIMKKTIMTFDLKKNVEKNLINRMDNLIKTIKKGKIKQAEKKIKSFIKNIESKSKKKNNKKIHEEEKQAILNMLNQLLINIK